MAVRHFIALIHKEPESGYGISFPDVPGVIAVADTLEDALAEAEIALGFAFEDWVGDLPAPRALDDLMMDPAFVEARQQAVVAAIRPAEPVSEAAQ
ncbi:hypothetical protein JP74_13075 [Devosia sp. 17-2-E-8]|nr:hypothetical protein JP74_13075 [Devosia sp. 17-2-E-8]